MKERLVITLVEHPLWGVILQPTLVTELSSGSLSILEIVDSHSSVFPHLDLPRQELVCYAEHFSEKTLMKNYSKEKNVAAFHKNIKSETIEKLIRPLIEKYHYKMIGLIVRLPLKIYFREAVKKRTLYALDRIYSDAQVAQSLFYFKKQEDGSLSYSIQVIWKNKVVDLINKAYGIICREPAVVCVDNALFVFEKLDAKKLLPFFEKKSVVVPPASRDMYIEKFVVSCVRDYDVQTEGVVVEQIFPKRKACLSFVNSWDGMPTFELSFMYNDKRYSPSLDGKKNVYAEDANGEKVIHWFLPDMEWEQEKTNCLLRYGLKRTGVNFFQLKEKVDVEELIYSYVHFLRETPEIIQEFELMQDFLDKTYCIKEVQLKEEVDEQIDWFDVKSVVEVGDFRIPFVKFRHHLIHGISEYILPDGSIFFLPKEWFSRYQEMMLLGKKSSDKLRFRKNQYQLLSDVGLGVERPPVLFSENMILVPPEIKASLRPYQQKGFSWLVQLFKNKYGGCLGDDMGLGKTLQTITLLQYVANQKNKSSVSENYLVADTPLFKGIQSSENATSYTSLVIVPTSLIHNWLNEISKFAPSLKVYAYAGAKRMKTKDIDKFFRMFDVVLTTYGTMRIDIELLRTAHFHHLILDESQFVRNPDSQTFRAVKKIQSEYKLALTGTLIENSLNDLWAQFDVINEGMLGSFSAFKKAYIKPILKENKEKQERLLRMVHPFILRRTKQEVAPELPPLTEEVVYCEMSDEQKVLYETEKSRIRNSLTSDSLLQERAGNFALLTLQGLTRLRLLANHPILLDENSESTSGKFEHVIMNLNELVGRGHKVLVFSSFVKHLRLYSHYFDKKKWKYALLTGEVLPQAREKEILRFQKNKDVNCFFISLKAGGVGLNLTAADYVFILDPWWNPAAEMQALSRSHRIGQNKNVIVYRFITSKTIEEKIRLLQESKSRLSEMFLSSTNPLQNMTKEDIEVLLN